MSRGLGHGLYHPVSGQLIGFDLQRLMVAAGDLAGRESAFAALVACAEEGAILARQKESDDDG